MKARSRAISTPLPRKGLLRLPKLLRLLRLLCLEVPSENAPTPYPLATFLLLNRIGYCQQFAGSMALLLRMGGVPAHVATGFTTGTYDAASKRWLVRSNTMMGR